MIGGDNVVVTATSATRLACSSPECIAANVIRALEYPDLEGVSERARALVEREFTYEKAVERWKEVLEEMGNDRGR